jgi:hypothetical protein
MAKDELWLNAYYYSFEPTGVPAIDKILSAVACAGKAYHHTEDWHDECGAWEPHTGQHPVQWIQNAANEAAMAWSEKGGEDGASNNESALR